MRPELEQEVDDVHQQKDLWEHQFLIVLWMGQGKLTTLVPRLILRDSESAFLMSLNVAWKAVWGRTVSCHSSVTKVFTHRQNQADDAQTEETSAHLRDCAVVNLQYVSMVSLHTRKDIIPVLGIGGHPAKMTCPR